MRALNEAQNINPADSDFVKGSTRNDVAGGAKGTIFSEELMGDLVQTIQKLISLNGLTENGLKDNETNKHQLLAALFQEGLPEWRSITSNVLFDNIKFVRYGDAIYFHKTTTNTTTPPSSDTTNWIKVLEYDSVNDRMLFNEYSSEYQNITAISGSVSIPLNSAKVNQIGRTVSGYVSFSVDSSIAPGLVDVFQLPAQVDYISEDNSSRVTAIPIEGSTQSAVSFSVRANGVIRVFDGAELVVGNRYEINFTYLV